MWGLLLAGNNANAIAAKSGSLEKAQQHQANAWADYEGRIEKVQFCGEDMEAMKENISKEGKLRCVGLQGKFWFVLWRVCILEFYIMLSFDFDFDFGVMKLRGFSGRNSSKIFNFFWCVSHLFLFNIVHGYYKALPNLIFLKYFPGTRYERGRLLKQAYPASSQSTIKSAVLNQEDTGLKCNSVIIMHLCSHHSFGRSTLAIYDQTHDFAHSSPGDWVPSLNYLPTKKGKWHYFFYFVENSTARHPTCWHFGFILFVNKVAFDIPSTISQLYINMFMVHNKSKTTTLLRTFYVFLSFCV
jgi:hypothetical protein